MKRTLIFAVGLMTAAALSWAAPAPVTSSATLKAVAKPGTKPAAKPAAKPVVSTTYSVRPSSQTVRRREAVIAMAQEGDPKSGPNLVAALADKDPMSRTLALQGIGNLKYAAGREKVAAVLAGDPNVEVREAAAFTLRQINDPRAVPALAAATKDAATNVRITALMGLGHYRDAGARFAVEEATQDSLPEVRRTAAHVLGRIEDSRAVPAVEALLKDADPTVRAVAAQSLGDLHVSSATGVLAPLLKDPSKPVQASAARSLLKLGDNRGLETAKALVLDEDLSVRLLSIDALGWSKDRDAVKTLEDIQGKVPADSQIAVHDAMQRQNRLRKQK